MDYFGAQIELKTVDLGQRLIIGTAAGHSNLDRVKDIIDPMASVKAARRLNAPSDVACFIGHDSGSLPVGIPQKIEATPEGLYTETYILKGPAGDNLLAVAKDLEAHGQALGMSIGYRTLESRPERVAGKVVRRILDYLLLEYSFAAHQVIANPKALVSAVKARRKAMSEGSDSTGGALVPEDDKANAPCMACMKAGEAASDSCTCDGCAPGGDGECDCADGMAAMLAQQGGTKMQYRVEQQGQKWAVICDADDDADADDNRVVGSYDSQEIANAVALALRKEATESGDDDNDAPNGGGDGKTMSESKAVWTQKEQNDLPDSSFMYIEDGGTKDSDGKTVPRGKRHFPIRDANGKLDLPHLRNAIARIPQSNAEGLDDAKKKSLQARARTLLEKAGGGDDGKTLDLEAEAWKSGAPLSVRGFAYRLLDLSEAMADELKAMALLGEETKSALRIRPQMREQLAAVAKDLTDLINWAETIDRGEDGKARASVLAKRLALIGS